MASTIILSDNGASSGSAGVKTTGGNDGVLILQTTTSGGTATAGITINNVQGVLVPNTIGVGGATPSTSGAGITFPATQSASTDANTLDDYEEGTWTPTWVAVSGSMSYASQVGRYVKVGKMVKAHCHIITTANNSLSGALTIQGLPFVSASTPYTIGCLHAENINLAASVWMWAYVAPSSTIAYFRYWVNNSSAGTVVGSNLNAASDVMFSVTYFTD